MTVAVAVVAHGTAPDGLLHVVLGHLRFAARGGVLVGELERRERVAGVAGSRRGDCGEHVGPGVRRAQRDRAALEDGSQIVSRVALELVQPAARHERPDDRVERVLGRGADQRHEPGLHDRQQRVLLRLVEAVDLVDEEHRAPALRTQPLTGAPDHRLDVGLAGRDRRELFERRFRARRDDARERGLAGAGRAEEDRRRHAVLLDRPPQRRPLAHELRLAGELVERSRAHAVGERRVRRAPLLGRVVEQAHEGTLGGFEQAEPRCLARGVLALGAVEPGRCAALLSGRTGAAARSCVRL